MSVGAKIKKYRELQNITQKELGHRLGFSEISSDVRIRQYESGRMTPKADLLKRFSDALGVPVEALTDHRIDNDSDFMRTLFDMEDRFGLTIDKNDDEYILIVDDSKDFKATAQAELSAWYKERLRFLTAERDITINTKEAVLEYDTWKSKYPREVTKNVVSLEENINAKYLPLKEQVTTFHPANMAEFVRHFELMAKAGIQINIVKIPRPQMLPYHAARFSYKQIMNLDDEAAVLFSKYLTMLDYFDDLYIMVEFKSEFTESEIFIDYIYHHSSFGLALSDTVDKMLKHLYAGKMEEYPFDKDYKTELDYLAYKEIKDQSYRRTDD